MGISIEQYRSSIGPHDNFVTTKDILSRFNDHFWSLMFVMFYLNVFYLPVLKQVVGRHRMWNDVMFWLSQMIFYNAYIPLLKRQANDVEENPGCSGTRVPPFFTSCMRRGFLLIRASFVVIDHAVRCQSPERRKFLPFCLPFSSFSVYQLYICISSLTDSLLQRFGDVLRVWICD